MAVVRTVLGELDSADLGPTLFHEHLLLNGETAWHEPAPDDAEGWIIAREPVRMEFLGRLRNDPYLSLDTPGSTACALRSASLERCLRRVGAHWSR